jgi:protein-tyrosine phosphatase
VKVFFVTRRLSFGSMINTRSDVEQLRRLGITHVINLLRNKNSKKIRQFQWLWLPFKDDKKSRPRWFYRKALKFHKRATRKRDGKVFVMCHHGICRSASLAYFLLRASACGQEEAESMIRRIRHRARIAHAYRQSAEEYLGRKGFGETGL